MKTTTILCVLLLSIGMQSYADGIKFYHGTWAEAQELAKKENKPIFVDFYATWCGPCVQLSKEVFTQKEVGEYFNQNIISFKVDAEKDELALVESIELEAYPTLIFFSADGKVIKRHVGYIEEEPLLELARQVSAYKKIKAEVLNGRADRTQQISYLSIAKNEDPEAFQKMAPALVASFTAEELKQPEAWAVYTGVVTEITSPDFNKAIENAEELNAIHEDFIDFASGQMDEYMMKLVDANDETGLPVYAQTMERLYNALVEEKKSKEYFELMAKKEFYRLKEDSTQYRALLIKWVDTYYTEDWEKLGEYAMELASSQEKAHQEKALSWATKAVKVDRNMNSVYTLAVVYEYINQKSNAIKTAKEVLKFDLSEENKAYIKDYIERLKG